MLESQTKLQEKLSNFDELFPTFARNFGLQIFQFSIFTTTSNPRWCISSYLIWFKRHKLPYHVFVKLFETNLYSTSYSLLWTIIDGLLYNVIP